MSSVDVIVPCYRYGNFLRQCVQSVLTQSGPRVRVLIIDDASPDNTSEVAADLARDDSRVTVLRHASNKGHIATYNEGIDWASADYVLILSADDYLLPAALNRAANLMDAHPEVGFTFGNAIRLDTCGGATRSINSAAGEGGRRIMTGLKFIELCGASNIVPAPTAVVRTELQRRLGGYRPELPHSGDMEMWLRFAAHASVGAINAYQAVYRRHYDNMSLAYMADGRLGDLQQAKAALTYFFESCGDKLPRPQQLHRRLSWLLACNAIGCASAALDSGAIEICDQLSRFALDLCPECEISLRWMKFYIKRLVVSRILLPLWPTAARSRKRITTGIRGVKQ